MAKTVKYIFKKLKADKDDIIKELELTLSTKYPNEFQIINSSVEYKISGVTKNDVKQTLSDNKILNSTNSNILIDILEVSRNVYIRVSYK